MSESSQPREIVIVGDGEFAEIAYEYFTHDSPHTVVGFTAERAYLTKDELKGLPVVAFEELEQHFPASDYVAHVAITYTQLNRVRARMIRATKAKGYELVNYVSSHAFVWHSALLGENVFVFENNVIQYGVEVGDGVVMWSGNHIGHQTKVRDHVFISSHVVVSGYCEIGENCFLGVNSSVGDFKTIGRDCIVGAGAVVVKDLEPGGVYVGNPAKPTGGSAYDSFSVPEDAR